MFVRTTHEAYLEKASQFIQTVVEKVKDLQFYTANGAKGGPIIMTQVSDDVIVAGLNLRALTTSCHIYFQTDSYILIVTKIKV